MDAYIYRAAVWCGPCVIKALVAAGKAAPGAIDMSPAEALQQIVSANGFTSESHYGSDDLPKGPYAEGGGEADIPQHCQGCGQFLGNPLTPHGLIWVEDVIRSYLTTRTPRPLTRPPNGPTSTKTNSTSAGSSSKPLKG
jgi:hypothetical protein